MPTGPDLKALPIRSKGQTLSEATLDLIKQAGSMCTKKKKDMQCSRQDTITLANNLISQFNRLRGISPGHSVCRLCVFKRGERDKAIIELEDKPNVINTKKTVEY